MFIEQLIRKYLFLQNTILKCDSNKDTEKVAAAVKTLEKRNLILGCCFMQNWHNVSDE